LHLSLQHANSENQHSASDEQTVPESELFSFLTLGRCAQLKLQGNELAANGDYARARGKYLEALESAPEHIAYKLHSNLSLLALTTGDLESAIAEAQEALRLAPSDFTTVSPPSHCCANVLAHITSCALHTSRCSRFTENGCRTRLNVTCTYRAQVPTHGGNM
jgi:tetratricopeptide (TPR) repeat protein